MFVDVYFSTMNSHESSHQFLAIWSHHGMDTHLACKWLLSLEAAKSNCLAQRCPRTVPGPISLARSKAPWGMVFVDPGTPGLFLETLVKNGSNKGQRFSEQLAWIKIWKIMEDLQISPVPGSLEQKSGLSLSLCGKITTQISVANL